MGTHYKSTFDCSARLLQLVGLMSRMAEKLVSTAHSFKAPQLISIRPVFDTFQERFAPNRYIDSILVIV